MTLWTAAHQVPLSTEFFRHEDCSRWPFPFPGDFPDPGMKLGSPALQADSSSSEPPGKDHQLGTRAVCRAEECKLLRSPKTPPHLSVTIAVCKRTAGELWKPPHSCFLNLVEIQNLAMADLGNLKRLWMKVKGDSGKAGLKLSIKKTKIMASGPITSWQIDGETIKRQLQNHCRW